MASPGTDAVGSPSMQHRALAQLVVVVQLLVGSLWLAACSRPQSPVVIPRIARVVGISTSSLDLALTLEVQNPNSYALSARRLKGILYLGQGQGQRLGSSESWPQQTIPAGGSAIVESKMQIAWTDLSALNQFVGQATVPYTFDGDLTLGSEHLNLTLPVKLQGSLTREQLLAAGLWGLLPP